MDAWEKLVELLAQKVCDAYSPNCDEWEPHDCGKCYANDCHISDIADHLIANDVTVREWISVKDRLPERTLPPKDVLVYHDLGCGMFVDRAWYSYDKKRWCSVLGMKLKVTHWMPLPLPPKGE